MAMSVATKVDRRGTAVSTAVRIALGACAGLACSPAVHCQTPEGNGSGLEEVVVTGSRIARRDLTSASPLVTVSTESLTSSAQVGFETVLNKLPQFSPGGNQFNAAADVQASPT